jgi:hypothetical protein
MLYVVILCVIMLSVIMLNVGAPFLLISCHRSSFFPEIMFSKVYEDVYQNFLGPML